MSAAARTRTTLALATALAAATVPVEVLRTGRHTDMSGREVDFTERTLDEIVASYDPKAHEAPVVIGHPRTNGPAYGWVRGVRRDGDRLVTDIAFAEGLTEAIRAGHYRKVSASLYTPSSVGNPTPGRYHLRHVGLLGAQPPAVKGLREIELAEHDGSITIEFSEAESILARILGGFRTWVAGQFGEEAAEAAIPTADLEAATSASAATDTTAAAANLAEPAKASAGAAGSGSGSGKAASGAGAPAPASALKMSVGQRVKARGRPAMVVELRDGYAAVLVDGAQSVERWLAADELELEQPAGNPGAPQTTATAAPPAASSAAATVSLSEERAELERMRRGIRRVEHESWLRRLVGDGHPLPAAREDIVCLFELLDAAGATTVSFAEPDVRSPSDMLRAILSRMPKQIDFSERGADDGGDDAEDDGDGVSFASGRATRDATDLANRAQAYVDAQAKKGVRVHLRDAIVHISKGRS